MRVNSGSIVAYLYKQYIYKYCFTVTTPCVSYNLFVENLSDEL
jgi:hypothetical protein